jgi:hypothetical protein
MRRRLVPFAILLRLHVSECPVSMKGGLAISSKTVTHPLISLEVQILPNTNSKPEPPFGGPVIPSILELASFLSKFLSQSAKVPCQDTRQESYDE